MAQSKGGGPDSYEGFLATRNFGSLDGLRALSIGAVLWMHTTTFNTGPPVIRRGFLGVDLFFEISGFLIVTLLLRERRAAGAISLSAFYRRRVLRIFPAYWVLLILAGAVAYLKPGDSAPGIKHDLPFALFYVSNLVPMLSFLSVTWSLSAEEQFYLIVPALQKYSPRIFAGFILPAAYVASCLPPFGFLPNLDIPDFFRQTTFGPILIGVMLAHVLDDRRGWTIVNAVLGHWLSPLVALLFVAAALNYPGADISGWPRLVIHWSFALFLGSVVVRERHVLTPLLRSLPMRRVGAVSYGMYLYHMLAYWPAAALLQHLKIKSPYGLFIVVAILTWVLAEMSYRFFEVRFLALKPQHVRRFDAGSSLGLMTKE